MAKIAGIVIIILIVVAVAAGFYLGIFNKVTIEQTSAGPYKIACLDHIGQYKNICAKIKNAEKLLAEQAVLPLAACGIYYDDPKTVPSDKLRSKGGFIIEGEAKLEILEKVDIPVRDVVLARIKAHPAVAALKIYPKINKYLIENNLTPAGPVLEIYTKDGIVEAQMPVTQKK